MPASIGAINNRSLEERNEDLARRLRDSDSKIRELEDRLQSMSLERDKIITDYETYVDKLIMEKDQLRGLEGMVKKLEAEKEFLENEIEKVRAIKMMLENQLNAYSESAEIIRYKNENERLHNDLKRLRTIIYTETGAEGDPNKMDIGKAISKYRSEVHYITQDNQRIQNEKVQMQRQMEELNDRIRFMQGDANAETKTLRNQLEAARQQISALQQVQADFKRTETEIRQQNQGRLNILEQENVTMRRQLDSMKNMARGGAGDETLIQEV